MDSQLPDQCSAQSNKYMNNQIATSSNHQEGKSGQNSQEEDPYYLPGKSLCITPLPKTISREELLRFLHQFGSIKRQHFGRNSLWIEYYDRY